jgi:putative transcriptional regulator
MTQSVLTDSLLRLNPAANDLEQFKPFQDALIYVVLHSAEGGAIGVNINRFLRTPVAEYAKQFPHLGDLIDDRLLVPNVLVGGPMKQDVLWILQPARQEQPYEVEFRNDAISLGLSSDAFADRAASEDARGLVGSGSAGWGPGQLEQELVSGLWLHLPVDYDLLAALPFVDPPQFAVHMFSRLRFGKAPPRDHGPSE